ncbi:MAG: methyl-accepting chemotaxis protein [Polyangiaceae bacterium]|nr:methyl-accepting chemotaxis protein [Polyangiaceae bacterium]
MTRNWTFGQKVGAGFSVLIALALLIGGVAIYALRTVVDAKDQVISVEAQNIIDAKTLALAAARRSAAARGYLLTKDQTHLDELRTQRESFLETLTRMRGHAHDAEARRMLDDIENKEADHRTASDAVIAQRQSDAGIDVVTKRFDDDVVPKRNALTQAIDAFIGHAERSLEEEKQAASASASSAITLVVAIAALAIGLALLIAFTLTSTLGRQVGTAVSQVQSSSAELQAAANQQATGAKQQATAMNEITTTISELLATSRQIAESAQRVAHIAEQTAGAARTGDGTVEKGNEAVVAMRRQVDLIVNHMLELGKKSQQIGAVLDIVSELAEQTNILAINATIEAAGAGEAGKRFAVVAEEIRKLADRVGGSTKEIRGLIDDVRSAVNTTVMTTETGSKAVDAGARQFAEVASSFKQIVGLVVTTTEAAKEIELSTKQQTTAVEQVDVAITNVAQATKETEASTGQTLQTASQLTGLSRELLRLVKPQTNGAGRDHTSTRSG